MLAAVARTKLKPQVVLLGLISLLNDSASEMIYPLLPVFLTTTLGATPLIVGLIEGTADALSSILKLVAGSISDRVPRRKPLVVGGKIVMKDLFDKIGLNTETFEVGRNAGLYSSTEPWGTSPRTRWRASLPRPSSRQAMTTWAPWRASAVAVSNPSPLLAPVTTAVLPPRSGMSFAVHLPIGGSSPHASGSWFSPSLPLSCIA